MVVVVVVVVMVLLRGCSCWIMWMVGIIAVYSGT